MQATAQRTPAAAVPPDTVILVGNPNVGKSVIFGLLTGRYVTVSNYPGTTVEVTRGTARAAGVAIRVLDTPGINTLIPQSEDERVTRDIILDQPAGARTHLVQVGDAKNLPRALLLALQLAEMGVPFVLCLNMNDEADSRGIGIDTERLSGMLGVEVFSTVATRRQGTQRLEESLSRAGSSSSARVIYDPQVEAQVSAIEPLMPESFVSKRSLALMVLTGDATLTGWLNERLDADALALIEASCRRLRGNYARSVAFVINQQRMKAAAEMAQQVTRGNGNARKDRWVGRALNAIGTLSMHPILGLPFLGVVLYVMYLFVGVLGAGTAVDWFEKGVFGKDLASLSLAAAPDGSLAPAAAPPGRGQRLALVESTDQEGGGVHLRVSAQTQTDGRWDQAAGEPLRFYAVPRSGSFDPVRETSPGIYETTYRPGPSPLSRIEVHDWSGFINPWLHAFFMTFVPWEILRDAFVGTYGLVTMGATYAIAIVLPIVATFFFAFSILEDSGYLPRLAIMVNKVFRLMGLNGKAVLPMVLGLGCDTMATLTTRILETKKERTIVIILLALGVPCSAQLGVIVGMLAGLSWKAAAIWSGVLTGVILLVGYLSAKLLPGRGSDFIMEIPPIRVPALANIATKTMARIEWYLKEAVPLFLLGTFLLFAADRLNLLRAAEGVFSPLITGVLGLPRQATEAFIIGFLRRDFGSAGLYRLADAGLLDPVQVVVSLVTVTLFIPCIANFFMIVKEKGMTVALLIAGFIFPFAVLVGGTLNYVLRAMRVAL